MTVEKLEKAQALKESVIEIKGVITGLRDRKRKAIELPALGCGRWKWLFRWIKRGEEEMAVVLDNNYICGTEFEVDEELLDLIINYFENKLSAKEKEFRELN